MDDDMTAAPTGDYIRCPAVRRTNERTRRGNAREASETVSK